MLCKYKVIHQKNQVTYKEVKKCRNICFLIISLNIKKDESQNKKKPILIKKFCIMRAYYCVKLVNKTKNPN